VSAPPWERLRQGCAVRQLRRPSGHRDERGEGDPLHHLGDPATEPPHLDTALELLETPGDFAFGIDLILDGVERRAASSR